MVRDKNRLGRLSEIWTIDGTHFIKHSKITRESDPQSVSWHEANAGSEPGSVWQPNLRAHGCLCAYKLTALLLVSHWGILQKKENPPWQNIKTARAPSGAVQPLKRREPRGCNTAVLLRARWLFLRVSSLTHHTWVFIYILFLFLCLGNMNSLFSVTDCSDSVPTQLKTNTVYCRVWMSEIRLLDAPTRDEIFVGEIRANWRRVLISVRLVAGVLAKIPYKVERWRSKLSITAKTRNYMSCC